MKVVTKSVIGVAAALLVGVTALTPVLVTAWGDNANGRDVYTLQEVNNGQLGDKITFNSITDSAIGDERNFVAAKLQSDVADKNIKWNANEIEVKDGETYTIRLYVHNNSPKGLEAIATGVTASFSLPTKVNKELTVVGYLNAPNATPTRYWDEVKFTSDDYFYLEYVDGSATYTNNIKTFELPDDIVVGGQDPQKGVSLGYEQLDGKIPGCFEYDGEVHIQVKAHKSVTANLEKKVRMKGTKDWNEAVTTQVGDEVEYQIEYTNLLNEDVNDVIIRDILPDNVEYVPNSTIFYNSVNPNGLAIKEETLTTSGINVGDHGAGANSYVRFTAKVVDDNLACGQNQLVNWANATTNNAVTAKDDASVMVSKTCEEQKPEVAASIEKKVRVKGTDKWSETVTAKVGDQVEYQIEYTNLLDEDVKDVTIRDILPDNVEYVKGSTKLFNTENPDGIAVKEDTLTTTGLNIGDHTAKANSYVQFTVKVVDENLKCGQNQIVNRANALADDAVTAEDDATLTVSKVCQTTPEPQNKPEPEQQNPQPQTQQPQPQTPSQIVDTGAGTVITGAIGAGSTVTMLGCYLASRKKLGR